MAYTLPSSPYRIHAMSSPIVSTVHPGIEGRALPGWSFRRQTERRELWNNIAVGRRHSQDKHVFSNQPSSRARRDAGGAALLAEQSIVAVTTP